MFKVVGGQVGCGKCRAMPLAVLVLASHVHAQSVVHSSGFTNRVNLLSGDSTILDAKERRKDLPCTVTPGKPELGFDLKFHVGYDVSIPMKDLNGGEDLLTMVFRVTPESHPDDPVYLTQRIGVPKLDPKASGDALLSGSFVVGEGKYQVDWLMRDRAERVCSDYWTSAATLSNKERAVKLAVTPAAVEELDSEPFRTEPPVARDPNVGLNVKVLVNFAPQRFLASSMQPLDTAALVSILRNISREPRIRKFTLVAFNMQEQRVVYRQEQADQIDFPKLGESLNSVKLGTVHVSQLEQKHSDCEFLSQLISSEMAHDHPDAVVFAGPKVMMETAVPSDLVKSLSEDVSYPVFYMNYNLTPNEVPWRDAIGNVVKRLRGYEYTISQPHELWNAWTDIMSHIVTLKQTRTSTSPVATR